MAPGLHLHSRPTGPSGSPRTSRASRASRGPGESASSHVLHRGAPWPNPTSARWWGPSPPNLSSGHSWATGGYLWASLPSPSQSQGYEGFSGLGVGAGGDLGKCRWGVRGPLGGRLSGGLGWSVQGRAPPDGTKCSVGCWWASEVRLRCSLFSTGSHRVPRTPRDPRRPRESGMWDPGGGGSLSPPLLLPQTPPQPHWAALAPLGLEPIHGHPRAGAHGYT